jgi:hypothetical protein
MLIKANHLFTVLPFDSLQFIPCFLYGKRTNFESTLSNQLE